MTLMLGLWDSRTCPRACCGVDTLHRFCKKEHDWGWKKFMELNKVLEGFTVSNTLVIKAQVQVIRRATHPTTSPLATPKSSPQTGGRGASRSSHSGLGKRGLEQADN